MLQVLWEPVRGELGPVLRGLASGRSRGAQRRAGGGLRSRGNDTPRGKHLTGAVVQEARRKRWFGSSLPHPEFFRPLAEYLT